MRSSIVPSPPLMLLLLLLQWERPAAAEPQPSAAEQLSQLLGPAVEAAVSRALAGAGPSCSGRWVELGRLEGRQDAVAHGLAELQLQFARLQARLEPATARRTPEPEPTAEPEPTPEPEPTAEPEPTPERACEQDPEPLPAGAGPYLRPPVLACARSCQQLRDQGGQRADGVYWFTEMSMPVLCDFSHDGGGWTLLLTVASGDGWDVLPALRRNERSPSLTDNYSILSVADTIRDLGTGNQLAYRIEAQAETGRRQWGGVWHAPRAYSFVHRSPTQTDVTRVMRFGNWEYKDTGIEKRMPWLNTDTGSAVLTTSASPVTQWFGTLVTRPGTPYKFSPWIHEEALHSGRVLYWLREDML